MYVKFRMRDANNYYKIKQKKATELRYITHILLKKGENVLYDASTSDSVFPMQIISLYADNTNESNTLQAILTYNTGEQLKCSKPINQSILEDLTLIHNTSKIKEDYKSNNYHTTHPKLWAATSFEEAIKILYGTSDVIKTKNKAYSHWDHESDDPKLAVSGDGEYLRISAVHEVESLMVLASYREKVVQYVIRIPENHSIGFPITVPINEKNFTADLRSFTTPTSQFKFTGYTNPYTVAIVYRLRNGKVYQQDFSTSGISFCEPQRTYLYVELRDTN
ncbi:hypothetical protein PF327_07890 [Sulfurovum sp. XTW-4]|uniref:Uncharacterized protein n=1 Tax=Sulfurovum xiamenensis TaxID=3019066 RepID=A0ABT7QSX4_9BACT|nr:hypothetical protein [Sulfurovum xiamenensis]MDM5264110.1 hypothetical protein [Sulfurovum xiamenensis]